MFVGYVSELSNHNIGAEANRAQVEAEDHRKGVCGEGVCEGRRSWLIIHLTSQISECLTLLLSPKTMETLLKQAG